MSERRYCDLCREAMGEFQTGRICGQCHSLLNDTKPGVKKMLLMLLSRAVVANDHITTLMAQVKMIGKVLKDKHK